MRVRMLYFYRSKATGMWVAGESADGGLEFSPKMCDAQLYCCDGGLDSKTYKREWVQLRCPVFRAPRKRLYKKKATSKKPAKAEK